jgi:hypothetical protein
MLNVGTEPVDAFLGISDVVEIAQTPVLREIDDLARLKSAQLPPEAEIKNPLALAASLTGRRSHSIGVCGLVFWVKIELRH